MTHDRITVRQSRSRSPALRVNVIASLGRLRDCVPRIIQAPSFRSPALTVNVTALKRPVHAGSSKKLQAEQQSYLRSFLLYKKLKLSRVT